MGQLGAGQVADPPPAHRRGQRTQEGAGGRSGVAQAGGAGAEYRQDCDRTPPEVGEGHQLQLDGVLIAVGRLVAEELLLAQRRQEGVDRRAVGADRPQGAWLGRGG